MSYENIVCASLGGIAACCMVIMCGTINIALNVDNIKEQTQELFKNCVK